MMLRRKNDNIINLIMRQYNRISYSALHKGSKILILNFAFFLGIGFGMFDMMKVNHYFN